MIRYYNMTRGSHYGTRTDTLQCMEGELEVRIDRVLHRLEALCQSGPVAQPWTGELLDLQWQDSETAERMRDCCKALGLTHWRLRRVERDYYEWSLEERARVLRAPSMAFLCKSMLMHNTKDPSSGVYLVVVVLNLDCAFLRCFSNTLPGCTRRAWPRQS